MVNNCMFYNTPLKVFKNLKIRPIAEGKSEMKTQHPLFEAK